MPSDIGKAENWVFQMQLQPPVMLYISTSLRILSPPLGGDKGWLWMLFIFLSMSLAVNMSVNLNPNTQITWMCFKI